MSVNKIWMHNYLFESNFIFHSLFLSGRALTRRQCGWWDRWFPACPAPFRARCWSWRGRCWRVGTTSLSLPRASRRRTATSRGQLAAEAVELTWQAGVAWVLVCFFLFLFWEIMQLSPYTVRVVKSHSCNRFFLFFWGGLTFSFCSIFSCFFLFFFSHFSLFLGGRGQSLVKKRECCWALLTPCCCVCVTASRCWVTSPSCRWCRPVWRGRTSRGRGCSTHSCHSLRSSSTTPKKFWLVYTFSGEGGGGGISLRQNQVKTYLLCLLIH